MTRQNLAEQLEALETMSPVRLHQQWHTVTDEAPPQVAPPPPASAHCATHAGKTPRQLASINPSKLLAIADGQEAVVSPSASVVNVGTRFIREWQVTTIEVVAVDGRFDWEGRRYGSLFRIAREATGAHQSGPRFFGLTGGRDHG